MVIIISYYNTLGVWLLVCCFCLLYGCVGRSSTLARCMISSLQFPYIKSTRTLSHCDIMCFSYSASQDSLTSNDLFLSQIYTPSVFPVLLTEQGCRNHRSWVLSHPIIFIRFQSFQMGSYHLQSCRSLAT